MRKKVYNIAIVFILLMMIPHQVKAQKLGLLGDAEFYVRASLTEASKLTRFAVSFNDATMYNLSMAIMVFPSLEVGATLSLESIDGLNGEGSLYGMNSYFYPLQQSSGDVLTIGVGAAVNGLRCSGSYGFCLDTQRGNEISLSSVLSYAFIASALNIIPNAEVGLSRSSWRIDSSEIDEIQEDLARSGLFIERSLLNESDNTIYVFGAVGATLIIPGPTGSSFALGPRYLFGPDDRRFDISIALLIN